MTKKQALGLLELRRLTHPHTDLANQVFDKYFKVRIRKSIRLQLTYIAQVSDSELERIYLAIRFEFWESVRKLEKKWRYAEIQSHWKTAFARQSLEDCVDQFVDGFMRVNFWRQSS